MSFLYLASPYYHENPEIMHERYLKAENAVAELLRSGIHVYSPIVHCHNMARRLHLPRDFDFWMAYDKAILSRAAGLVVLTLLDWESSKGVAAEIAFARENNIPIFYYIQKETSYGNTETQSPSTETRSFGRQDLQNSAPGVEGGLVYHNKQWDGR